jgi:Xaa-Pro aminopeptidase
LEGHESPYLVGSNDQPIQKGNVFSDEPGIYIPGELGIRLEDCWFVNEEGKGELLTSQAKDYWSI